MLCRIAQHCTSAVHTASVQNVLQCPVIPLVDNTSSAFTVHEETQTCCALDWQGWTKMLINTQLSANHKTLSLDYKSLSKTMMGKTD